MGTLLSVLNTLSVGASPGFTALPGTGGWRPPQWNQPALTSITVPASQQQSKPSTITDELGNTLPSAPSAPIVYVFDSVLHIEHEVTVRQTQHPVQSGANISDHAIRMPARVVLEIGMSDAMDSYSAGTWTGNASKSVNAFQTLIDLQSQRLLLTLTTRLKTYSNMLVTGIAAPDDIRTRFALKARITFEEILVATVTAVSSSITYGDEAGGFTESARPQTTAQTAVGTVQASAIPQSLTKSNNILENSYWNAPKVIPGAGSWSSLNLAGLNEIVPGLITRSS